MAAGERQVCVSAGRQGHWGDRRYAFLDMRHFDVLTDPQPGLSLYQGLVSAQLANSRKPRVRAASTFGCAGGVRRRTASRMHVQPGRPTPQVDPHSWRPESGPRLRGGQFWPGTSSPPLFQLEFHQLDGFGPAVLERTRGAGGLNGEVGGLQQMDLICRSWIAGGQQAAAHDHANAFAALADGGCRFARFKDQAPAAQSGVVDDLDVLSCLVAGGDFDPGARRRCRRNRLRLPTNSGQP